MDWYTGGFEVAESEGSMKKPPSKVYVDVANPENPGFAYTEEEHSHPANAERRAFRVLYVLAPRPKRKVLCWVLRDNDDDEFVCPKTVSDRGTHPNRTFALRFPTKHHAREYRESEGFLENICPEPIYRKESK